MQPMTMTKLPEGVGTLTDKTLDWLKTADPTEVMYFYERMDGYPISKAKSNYGSLITAVTRRAAELDMDIKVSRREHGPMAKGYFVESPVDPDDPGPEEPPHGFPSSYDTYSDVYHSSVAFAERFLAEYDGTEDTSTVVLEMSGIPITLKDFLDMAWVFMQFAEEVARP